MIHPLPSGARGTLTFALVAMLGLWLGMSSASVQAGTVKLVEDGIAVTLPEGWAQAEIPAAASEGGNRTVLMAHNADQTRLLILTVQAIAVKDAAGIDQFLDEATDSHEQRGWKTSDIRDLKVHGVPFTYFSVSQQGATEPMLFTACTFTSSRVYGLMGIAKGGDADTDKELKAILESFEFLQPMPGIERTK